jgi:hypothetical protein
MNDRVTKQGVRDLNPKGYNGRRHARGYEDPIECAHNWQEGVVIGTYDAGDGIIQNMHPLYGKKCLWCGDKKRT